MGVDVIHQRVIVLIKGSIVKPLQAGRTHLKSGREAVLAFRVLIREDQLNPNAHRAMQLKPKGKLSDHFSEIEDPRIERTKRHKLIDLLTIAILAVICGADSWVGMESFGQAKHSWRKRLLALPNGIPSHDTFARVFARLNPEQFQACFLT